MQARINSILRENELLKHQLKKYVGAVQKLRDGPQAHETLAQLEGKLIYNTPPRNKILCQLFRVLRQQWISAKMKVWH